MKSLPTFNEYADLCARTVSVGPGGGDDNSALIHGILGATSEVGELADAAKRFMFYGKPLDLLNLKEEIGDVLWYLVLLAKAANCSLQDCAEANIRKLSVRYPAKFSSERASERDLEAEKAALKGSTGNAFLDAALA